MARDDFIGATRVVRAVIGGYDKFSDTISNSCLDIERRTTSMDGDILAMSRRDIFRFCVAAILKELMKYSEPLMVYNILQIGLNSKGIASTALILLLDKKIVDF